MAQKNPELEPDYKPTSEPSWLDIYKAEQEQLTAQSPANEQVAAPAPPPGYTEYLKQLILSGIERQQAMLNQTAASRTAANRKPSGKYRLPESDQNAPDPFAVRTPQDIDPRTGKPYYQSFNGSSYQQEDQANRVISDTGNAAYNAQAAVNDPGSLVNTSNPAKARDEARILTGDNPAANYTEPFRRPRGYVPPEPPYPLYGGNPKPSYTPSDYYSTMNSPDVWAARYGTAGWMGEQSRNGRLVRSPQGEILSAPYYSLMNDPERWYALYGNLGTAMPGVDYAPTWGYVPPIDNGSGGGGYGSGSGGSGSGGGGGGSYSKPWWLTDIVWRI